MSSCAFQVGFVGHGSDEALAGSYKGAVREQTGIGHNAIPLTRRDERYAARIMGDRGSEEN